MRIGKAVGDIFALLNRNRQAVFAIVLILLAVLTVYWRDLTILAKEAIENESFGHVIFVPFLAAYLAYRKRDTVKASLTLEKLRGNKRPVSVGELVGSAVCFSALLVYWYGSYTFSPLEFHVASIPIFLMGMILALFGAKSLLALAVPVLFLFFLVPPMFGATFAVAGALQNFSTQSAYGLLGIVGIPATLSSEYGPPAIIIRNSANTQVQFAVDVPCSGIYSLLAFAMFASFLVLVIKGTAIKKIALLAIGSFMLPLLNIARIFSTVAIASSFGEAAAMNVFHVFSGWLLILVGMLALFLIAERLLRIRILEAQNKPQSCTDCNDALKSKRATCPNCGKFLRNPLPSVPKRFWIKMTAILLGSYLAMFSIQAPVFAFAQGLTIKNPSPETGVDAFPPAMDYQLKFLSRDESFEKVSGQDASLLYAYFPRNVSNPTIYVLVGVADSIINLHNWEVCLVTWQTAQGYAPSVTVLDSRDIQLVDNPPITARYFSFRHPANYIQVTLYWYQQALFKTGLTVEPKYTRISLVILTQNASDIQRLEAKLLDISQSIVTYWKPIKAQSLVALGVPTIQVLLASTLTFALIIQAMYLTREWRIRAINRKIFQKLASPEEKLLTKTIDKLDQEGQVTTTQNILSAFSEAIDKPFELNKLVGMLNNLERHGIIRADMENVLDQPRLVWKP